MVGPGEAIGGRPGRSPRRGPSRIRRPARRSSPGRALRGAGTRRSPTTSPRAGSGSASPSRRRPRPAPMPGWRSGWARASSAARGPSWRSTVTRPRAWSSTAVSSRPGRSSSPPARGRRRWSAPAAPGRRSPARGASSRASPSTGRRATSSRSSRSTSSRATSRPAAEDDAGLDFSLVTADGASALGSTFLPDRPDRRPCVGRLRDHGARYVPAIASAPVVATRSLRPAGQPRRAAAHRCGAGPAGRVRRRGPRAVGHLDRSRDRRASSRTSSWVAPRRCRPPWTLRGSGASSPPDRRISACRCPGSGSARRAG